MSQANELVTTLLPVVAAFNRLRIPFYVGGSIASSYHGAIRSTMDIDIVSELQLQHVDEFLSQFSQDFYVSETAVRQAIARRSCFNLINFGTSLKVDIFVSRGRMFDRACMLRAETARMEWENGTIDVPIATVEDIIISKLEWYRLTDETSERQWDDVNRLIRLVGRTLDRGYLEDSAKMVGVSDLLDRLLRP
jgi:hypothetical protein